MTVGLLLAEICRFFVRTSRFGNLRPLPVLLTQHKKFVGCSVDSDMLKNAGEALFLTLATQSQNLESNINVRRKMNAAANVFKDEWAEFLLSKKAGLWSILLETDATQLLLHYNLHFKNYRASELLTV